MIETLALAAVIALAAPADHAGHAPTSVLAGKADPGQTGIQPSAYVGRYYRAALEPFRKCIAQREGRGQYWITGSGGRYQSTYQMTPALVRGAAWMMTAELKAMHPKAWRGIRDTLLRTPGSRWHRQYMDQAFWTIVNWDHDLAGAPHWAGGRFHCTPGMRHWGGPR
jgi:hypothetical protein